MISNWEPVHSLVEGAVSGAEIAAASCLPALAVACLPVCLQQGGVYMQPALLWYSSILCSASALGCMLEPFTGKFFFFFSFSISLSLEIPRFGLLYHVSSLRLFSGHLSLVLTLRSDDAACTSLPRPCSLVTVVSFWANSPLEVVVRHIFCVFFFFSWLCFPLRF